MSTSCIFISNKTLFLFLLIQLSIPTQSYDQRLNDDDCPINDRKWYGEPNTELITDTWENCGESCCGNSECMGWSWKPDNDRGHCYMYHTARSIILEEGVYSGDRCCTHPDYPCPIVDKQWVGWENTTIFIHTWELCETECCSQECILWSWKDGICHMYTNDDLDLVDNIGEKSGEKCCMNPPSPSSVTEAPSNDPCLISTTEFIGTPIFTTDEKTTEDCSRRCYNESLCNMWNMKYTKCYGFDRYDEILLNGNAISGDGNCPLSTRKS